MLLGGYTPMREKYITAMGLKKASLGYIGMYIKLYPEEAEKLKQMGFEVYYYQGNKYCVSWVTALNDIMNADISRYIYGLTDDFPACVETLPQRLSVIALRYHNTK